MKKHLFILLVAVLLAACAPLPAAPLDGVEAYLVKTIGSPSFGGRVFCAYDVLATEVHQKKAAVYVWALCEEYTLDDGALTMGSGSSLPVAIYMEKAGQAYVISGYSIPLDGAQYMTSIRRTFPGSAIKAMCHEKPDCYNERAIRLEQTIQAEARESFGLK